MNDSKTESPGGETARYLSLDVIRGVAVMGILGVNIVGFALPEASYGTPVGPMSDAVADRLSWLVTFLFFDGKFMALFAMLFGASAMLIMERVEVAGGPVARRHYMRMIWLFVFGLIHLFLIWWGDILYYYSVSGMLLYFARHAPAYKLMTLGFILLAMDLALGAYVAQMVLSLDPGNAEDARTLAQLEQDIGYYPRLFDAEVAAYRGGYFDGVAWRAEVAMSYLVSAFTLLPQLLGTMLIGAALYRSGFLTAVLDRRYYRNVAAICVLVALLVQVPLAMWAVESDYSPPVMAVLSGAPYPLRLMMAVGYAAIIILVLPRHGSGWISRSLACAGRMSFTNYIGTSIVMTSVFYGFGLSLFARIERVDLWWFVFAGWAGMMLFSSLWLARFRQGPLEYIWRRLSNPAHSIR